MADKKLVSAELAVRGIANATLTPKGQLPVGDAGYVDEPCTDGTWIIKDINSDKATGQGRSYRASNTAYPRAIFNLLVGQTFTKARMAMAERDMSVKNVTDVLGHEFKGPALITQNWVQSTDKNGSPLVVKADDGTECWVWGKQITASPTGEWAYASQAVTAKAHLDIEPNTRSTGVLLAGNLREMDHAFGAGASGEVAKQFSTLVEYS